jgi:Pentapeptide repeats (8 copies)
MNDTERLREIANSAIDKSNDVAEVKSAAELLKLTSEIETQRAEARKLAVEEKKVALDLADSQRHRRSEDWKAIVSQLVPVLSIVILAATLFVQTVQKSKEMNAQAEASLDTQWSDAVKLLAESDKISPAGAMLKRFAQTRYAELAYKMAIAELSRTDVKAEDHEAFDSLFNSVFAPVNWDTLPQVVELDRTLWSVLNPLMQKSYDHKHNRNDPEHKLSETEQAKVRLLNSNLETITKAIAPLLKGPRPNGKTVDLSWTDLINADFQGAHLSGANLAGATFSGVNIRDADLGEIKNSEFEGSRFFSTPWWQVSHINQDFLKYLEANYPCQTSLDSAGQSPSKPDCEKIESIQEIATSR